MIRLLPELHKTDLKTSFTARELQQQELYVEESALIRALRQRVAGLERDASRKVTKELQLEAESSGAVGRVVYDGATGLAVERIR